MRSAEGRTAALTVPDKHKTSRDKGGGAAPRQEVSTGFLVDSASVFTECFLPHHHQ